MAFLEKSTSNTAQSIGRSYDKSITLTVYKLSGKEIPV